MEKINFKSRTNIDDLDLLQSTVEYEILERTKAIIGAYLEAGASYGIVSETTPVGVTDSSKPFAVTTSTTDLRLNVNGGMIVTQTGQIAIADTVVDLNLADDTEGVVNLVIAEYSLVNSTDRPSLFNDSLVPARYVRGTVVSVITLNTYNDLSQFSSSRRENSVVLAAVQTFTNEASVLKLNIDTTREIHSFIRPWFSPVDIEHRQTKGNPHETTYSDLAAGNLTIFQQLLSFGTIISKDLCHVNIAGCELEETFEISDIFTDTNGTVTGTNFRPQNVDISIDRIRIFAHDFGRNQRIRFSSTGVLPTPLSALTDYYILNPDFNDFAVSLTPGGAAINLATTGSGVHRIYAPDTAYLKLLHYPTQIGTMYQTDVPQNKIAGKILPGKNIIVLSKFDIKVPTYIRYFYTRSAEPPINVFNNSLTFSQPEDNEVIISGGKEFAEILSPTINFENSGPIPKNFKTFFTKEGTIIRNPAIVLTSLRLTNLTTPFIFDTSLYGDAKIVIGLTQATGAFSITLRVIGKDILGNTYTEDLTFTNSDWSDSAIPATLENEDQFKNLSELISQLTSIEVLSRTGDGPNSTIIVYADYSEPLNEALPLADVFWNGFAVTNVTDARKICSSIGSSNKITINEDPLYAGYLLNAIDTPSYPLNTKTFALLKEDFGYPKHLDTTCVDSPATQPTGTIKLNLSTLTAGDTIEVAPSKILTFVALYVNGPDFGEVEIAVGDEPTTRASLISTINNVVFASGVVATDDAANTQVIVTATTNDSNFMMNKTTTAPSAITLNGFSNGFLLEKAIVRDRFYLGLNGDEPIPTAEAIRNKYRTNPVVVNRHNITKLLVVGYGVEKFFTIEAKPTYQNTFAYPGGDRPYAYQPKVVGSPTNIPNVWVFTFPQNLAKVYFEIFGKMRGLAVYAIVP